MVCEQCKRNIGQELRSRCARVNDALHQAGLGYHDTLGKAIDAVSSALESNGFLSGALHVIRMCEGEYRAHVEVGEGKYVTACFHQMPSGRFELVAYVN